MKWPANRITNTSKKSFGMFEKALAIEAAGHDLIHLEFGKPHHDTPQHIKDGAIAALQAGKVHYSDLRGEPALRAALAAKLAADNAIHVGPEGILVTNGLTHAAYLAFMAALDEGDEVILLDPYYPQHINKIELAGGVPVIAPLDRANGFAIRADWIEHKITARTRMIVLVNPSNPTGRVYTRAELEAVAELAIQHDLLVLTDEVYEHVLYDGAHISIASLPGMAERTLSLFAFTKAYAMDGWRLGYIAAQPAMIPAMLKIAMNDVTHVNTFIQYGALAAVTAEQDSRDAMVADDRRKRDFVVQRMNQMPGVTCASPEATIYAFANIEGTGKDSTSIALDLLEKAHVVVEDGSFYGVGGRGHIRICFGSEPMPRIEQAMDRLSTYFNALPNAGDKA